MNTEETAKVLILSSNFSKLFPILGDSEEVDYSCSKFSPPYFVYFIKEIERFGATPRLSRIIFGTEEKRKFLFLYDSEMLVHDWEAKKKYFSVEKPEAYVHLAIAYWYCRDSFCKAKEAIECFRQKNSSKYTIESILSELVKLFPKAQDGSFLAFSIFLASGMISEAKSMFNFMELCQDADFEFLKGASLLFDGKYGQAKDHFDQLAKDGDLLAKAYCYWALSLEEMQKKDRIKSSTAFNKCYEAFKKVCLFIAGEFWIVNLTRAEKPLP